MATFQTKQAQLEIPLHDPVAAPGPRVGARHLAGVAAAACLACGCFQLGRMTAPPQPTMSLALSSAAVASPDATEAAALAVLEANGLSVPDYNDPVFISGHASALWVYRTPNPEVRVEGLNVCPSDSCGVAGGMFKPMLIYAQAYQTTGVELRLPTFFLPNDRRELAVMHQGSVVHRCQVPSAEVCQYSFTAADAGKRFTVKATEVDSGKLLQIERIYAPLPYMCAASTYSRTDVDEMDCSKVSLPDSMLNFTGTSNRGFAIEIEFSARSASLSKPVYYDRALTKVRQCVNEKLAGSRLQLEGRWHWEPEDAMIPFTPRDTSDPKEYVGYMAELTSPGPPEVLLGQQGIDDVAAVFATLGHMSIQVGLWAQFHVHVNAFSSKANPNADCCLSSDEIANVWAAWASFQPVIDEMQSSTNVDNQWAAPLYLEDPIAMEVFENMHKVYGTDLPAEEACETFYGKNACDGSHHENAFTPPNAKRGESYEHSPHRYYAVNLAPLTGKGTIEFRQQAGTHDPERAQRWAQFVLAFVETFKQDASFFQGSLSEDVRSLKRAQEQASFDSLFQRLGQRVDDQSHEYYAQRQWTKEDPRCTDRKSVV